MMEAVHCNWPATIWPAGWSSSLKKWYTTKGSLLVSVTGIWALSSGYSQISPGECTSVLPSLCITSIPATMATLFTSQLVKEQWLCKEGCLISRKSYFVYQIITLLFCCSHTVMSKAMNMICPFREIYSYTSSLGLLVTNFPSPWPPS